MSHRQNFLPKLAHYNFNSLHHENWTIASFSLLLPLNSSSIIPERLSKCTVWKVSLLGVILVRIFPHSDWIRRDTSYLSVFSVNARKCGPEYLRIQTILTQWWRFLYFISNLSQYHVKVVSLINIPVSSLNEKAMCNKFKSWIISVSKMYQKEFFRFAVMKINQILFSFYTW